jgi:hypothetical protein
MIKLILKFLGLCDHKWQTAKAIECTMENFYRYTRIQCFCKECGKWKTFTIK